MARGVDKERAARPSSSASFPDVPVLLPLLFAAISAASTAVLSGSSSVPRGLALDAVSPGVRCEDATPPTAAPDSALNALYASGDSWDVFLMNARARRAMWEKHWESGTVPADVLAQARALPGRWRLLVIAVDGCSDSVNTIPYLAQLVEQVPQLEMRIVTPDAGRAIMERHRTPDGRAATPTVLLLDDAGTDAGCWVERPAALQAKAIAYRAEGRMGAFPRDKQTWYDKDAGASTVREVVTMIAAAAGGGRICGVTGEASGAVDEGAGRPRDLRADRVPLP